MHKWAPKFRARYLGYGLGIFATIFLVLGIFLAVQVKNVASSLRHLQSSAQETNPKVFAENYKDFSRRLDVLSAVAGNPVWKPIFFLVGSPSTYSHEANILRSTSVIVKSLSPIFDAADARSPGLLTNMELLQRSAPILTTVTPDIQSVLTNLATLHLGGLLSPFDSKLAEVRKTASATSIVAQRILPMLPALPTIVGSEGPRTYLVAFQNPAEARGVAGIIGSYALVRLEAGKLSVLHVGSNLELESRSQLPIKVPAEYRDLYGNDPAIWQNSNLSPHFPYAAKIWLTLWKLQHKEVLDGVITFDPLVLRQILVATGPITVEGEKITAANVAQKTMSDAYIRYSSDNAARKQHLVLIIDGVLSRLQNGKVSGKDLINGLSSSIVENRILFYSGHKSEQDQIALSSISGSLSTNNDNQYRVVVNNIAGNKMDYYLVRQMTLTALTCGEKRTTKVDVVLQNTARPDLVLPAYVNGRLDLNKPNGDGNSTAVEVMFFGPRHSSLLNSVNAPEIDSTRFIGSELGHPVLAMNVELKPEVPLHLTATFKGGSGALTNIVQPLVLPEKVTVIDKCGR